MRIVPILKDIGLWGPSSPAFDDMGVLGFADTDIDSEMADDEAAARSSTSHADAWPT